MLFIEGDVSIANILVMHVVVHLKERLEFFFGQVARQKVIDVRIEEIHVTFHLFGYLFIDSLRDYAITHGSSFLLIVHSCHSAAVQ
jgi:hypothetical protein